VAGHAVRVARLRKVYGSVIAVDDVSLDVERGEIFGIIGPNGSGKTTTVECLQGLRVADAGEIDVLGLDPRVHGQELRRRIGSQLQESALPDRLKVWEALDLFASHADRSRGWRDLAEEWGIGHRAGAAFASLSGGERQRLFVALALINQPELVFLDEMTTGLDPAARRVTWSLVEDVRRRGTTVVLITHFMDEAEQLCDRIAVFGAGRVVTTGSPAELIRMAGGGATVRFSGDPGAVPWLREVPGVTEVGGEDGLVVVRGSGPLLARVAAALVARGIEPEDIRVDHPTLEDVYLRLTREGAYR